MGKKKKKADEMDDSEVLEYLFGKKAAKLIREKVEEMDAPKKRRVKPKKSKD